MWGGPDLAAALGFAGARRAGARQGSARTAPRHARRLKSQISSFRFQKICPFCFPNPSEALFMFRSFLCFMIQATTISLKIVSADPLLVFVIISTL